MHPLKAWRVYLKLESEDLSRAIEKDSLFIEQIECSNLHLKSPLKEQLAYALKIDASLLDFRYMRNYLYAN
jgi:hypothetical protein